jgi:cellulose biosynthesis protein BcsQ
MSIDTLTLARKARKLIKINSDQVIAEKNLYRKSFEPTYTQGQLTKVTTLSKARLKKAIDSLEAKGFVFTKEKRGQSSVFAMPTHEVVKIYEEIGELKHRDEFSKALTLCIQQLKGGSGKSVSIINLAQAFRCAPELISKDLRILVVDLDPQATATMSLLDGRFVSSDHITAAQATLGNYTRDDLLHESIINTTIENVSVMPAAIEDGFLAQNWNELFKTEEHLIGKKPLEALKSTLQKIENDFDIILIDCGPHLDSLLLNTLVASDVLAIPCPPSQIDFHSTLTFLSRIKSIEQMIIDSGSEFEFSLFTGFMTKYNEKDPDHKNHKKLLAKVIDNFLDSSLKNSKAIEKVGNTYDTLLTVQAKDYAGSPASLKSAVDSLYNLATELYEDATHSLTEEFRK